MGENGLGFVGKIPSNGDFVSRGLTPGVKDLWIEWCQRALNQSRVELGERWIHAFLTSPVWKFVLGPDVCGSTPSIGLMIPSVDRAGRYFPFILLHSTREVCQPFDSGIRAWLDRSEELILGTLTEGFDFSRFLDVIGNVAGPRQQQNPHKKISRNQNTNALHLGMGNVNLASECHWLSHVLFCYSDWTSFWWTDGSDDVDPCYFLSKGLPKPELYRSMLTGDFETDGCDSYLLQPR